MGLCFLPVDVGISARLNSRVNSSLETGAVTLSSPLSPAAFLRGRRGGNGQAGDRGHLSPLEQGAHSLFRYMTSPGIRSKLRGKLKL